MDHKNVGFGDRYNHTYFAVESSQVLSSLTTEIANGSSLEKLLGDHPNCIYLKSVDNRILYSNPACQRILGSDALVVGQYGVSLVSPALARISMLSND